VGKGFLLVLAVLGGEVVGGLVPLLWGDDVFSLTSIVGAQIGGALGFILMYEFLSDEK
jgi:hypothetical protein